MKVRCITDDFDSITYGVVYDVKEEDEYCYKIVNEEGEISLYTKDNFEVVREEIEEETKEEHKFKLGDRVRTLNNIGYLVNKGVEGTVIGIEYGDVFVEWDEGQGDRCWYANVNEVELVESKDEDFIDNLFSWDAFENGNLCVLCDTKEKASDFLKKCHERGLSWSTGDSLLRKTEWEDEKENTVYCRFRQGITYDNYDFIKNERCVDIFKWNMKEEPKVEINKDGVSVNGEISIDSENNVTPIETNKNISFAEVMNHILDGQTWSDGTVSITKEEDGVTIEFNDTTLIFTNDYKDFRLQRPKEELSFNEAFELYEQGKEIESLVSEERYKKREDGTDMIWDDFDEDWIRNDFEFELREIRGKWIVNE